MAIGGDLATCATLLRSALEWQVVALPRVELVASGAVDPASIAPCDTGVDVWALGITVYELLSGHLPFDGRDKVLVLALEIIAWLEPQSACWGPHT